MAQDDRAIHKAEETDVPGCPIDGNDAEDGRPRTTATEQRQMEGSTRLMTGDRRHRTRRTEPQGERLALPAPVARKPLREMRPEELRDWLAAQQAELEDFASYAQGYLKRRARRGSQTLTDQRYEQFLEKAADLINGLGELQVLIGDVQAMRGEANE